MMKIASRQPSLLRTVISVCLEAWPEDGRHLQNRLLSGIADFVEAYRGHPDYSESKLRKGLQKRSLTTLLQRMDILSSTSTSSRPAILWAYNYGLQTKALPEATLSDLKRLNLGQNPWTTK